MTSFVTSSVEPAEIIISGSIPSGPTTANVAYFVVDRARNALVGNITLPDASLVAHAFRLKVRVPCLSDAFDVGVFDAAGDFISAGFKIETPQTSRGAAGPIG